MLAGHTKFSVDQVFSKISNTNRRSDVFTTAQLGDIAGLYADVIIDNGELIFDWRNALAEKYTTFPGIKKLHDFVTVCHPSTQNAAIKAREFCYDAPGNNLTDTSIELLSGCTCSCHGCYAYLAAVSQEHFFPIKWIIFFKCIGTLYLVTNG